jgi:predicted Zn-dependent peptidase
MTDDEINVEWSRRVAELAADVLVTAKLITKEQFDQSRDIITEEISVRLALGDRPDRSNHRYKLN